jgi:uncharacterized RDD family membrane protein YckC
MKTNVLRIHTPEGVVFSQLLASPVVRCAAWLIDSMAIGALMMVPGFLVTILRLVSADIAEALYAIAYFVLSIGYGMGCEWLWRGQTLGKKLFRLRVVDAEGLRLRFNQIVIRNLIRSVDALPLFYLVGGITCWLNPKGQRLGDIAANTVVVRASRVAEPNLDQLLASKFNSLRLHPHLEARLRQQVSPAGLRLPCRPCCAGTISIRRPASNCSPNSPATSAGRSNSPAKTSKVSATSNTCATPSMCCIARRRVNEWQPSLHESGQAPPRPSRLSRTIP